MNVRQLSSRGGMVTLSVIACNLLIIAPIRVPVVDVLAGVWLAVLLPTGLVGRRVKWHTPDAFERVVCSLTAWLLTIMSVGLISNTVLPVIGVDRPLSEVSVLVQIDAVLVAVALLWRARLTPLLPRQVRLFEWPRRDKIVLGGSLVAVPLSIVGAIRLNNGAGNEVTLIMLVLVATVLMLLLVWSKDLRSQTINATIYLIGAALLLMTSLRGWYAVGHDIQRELRVFELTSVHQQWDIARDRDAYNSCLSITILPTMLGQLTHLRDVYVFKVLYQLFFALCPVLVYRFSHRVGSKAAALLGTGTSRRIGSRGVALLGTLYFVAFPTYFTDMPFMNRQEIAFLFLGVILLVATNEDMPLRTKRAWIALFSVGLVLSHYSTTYVFCAMVFISALSLAILQAGRPPLRHPASPVGHYVGRSSIKPVIGATNVAFLVGVTFLWNAGITQTTGGLQRTLRQVVLTVQGAAPDSKSSDVGYSLLGAPPPNPAQQLRDFAAESRTKTAAGRRQGVYYSDAVLRRYPAPVAYTRDLPLTSFGRTLERAHVNVNRVNIVIRQWSAKLLQLFICIGLVVGLLFAGPRLRPTPEVQALAIASFAIIVVQTIMPILSVEYGVLRSFEQALMVLAPFLAAGSITFFQWLVGRALALRAAVVYAVVFFLSLTGVVPQLLGEYPPQLHLNNEGLYYDLYYLNPQELVGVEWLHLQRQRANSVQAAVSTDPYTFARTAVYSHWDSHEEIYPILLRRDGYVFVGSTIIRKGLSTIDDNGDLITYRYPIGLLDSTRNLIYDNGDVRVYR
jgi:uncharacterized membrane protein